MKRINSFVLSALLAVVFTTAHAQQNIFIWKNGGNISVKSVANFDSITIGEKPTNSTYTFINGHKFVDLGLPSGLLWAETNVGASSSVDDGDYFAWGETEPKSSYSLDTYKWYDEQMTKYNSSDGNTTLDAEDDAATVNWGAPCRMPSSSEFSELHNQCNWSWKSSYNGTSGYLVTGPNGNTIFFPASGYSGTVDIGEYGTHGCYWLSSLDLTDKYCAYNIYFRRDYVYSRYYDRRWYGYSVRPVVEK